MTVSQNDVSLNDVLEKAHSKAIDKLRSKPSTGFQALFAGHLFGASDFVEARHGYPKSM